MTSSSTTSCVLSQSSSSSLQQPQKPLSPIVSFISGGVGGLCSVVVGYPLDLVKVRIQTMSLLTTTPKTRTKIQQSVPPISTYQMLQRAWVQDGGIRGLYRGVSVPLLTITPMMAVNFWSYHMGQRIVLHYYENYYYFQSQQNHHTQTPPSLSPWTLGFLAGGLSAGPVCLLSGPIERIKCLLQVQHQQQQQQNLGRSRRGHHRHQYKGIMDCIQTLYYTPEGGGIRSIFKGTIATMIRDIPGAAAWYGSYEFLKIQFTLLEQQQFHASYILPSATASTSQDLSPASPSSFTTIMSGGLAGVFYWIVAMPMDVIKSRYQTSTVSTVASLSSTSSSSLSVMEKSWMHVFQQLIRQEGIGALYYGIKPACLRAFPANAATFYGMEFSKDLLLKSNMFNVN